MLTPLAAECFPGSCGGGVDHNMKPITAVMLLFLSEQHPDTGAADSFRVSQPHLTTGLGVLAHVHHTSSRHLVDPEENPKGACYVEGEPSQRRPVPLPREDPAPSEPHSPSPAASCAPKQDLCSVLESFMSSYRFSQWHIHLTTATTAKRLRLTPCLRI